MLAHYPHCAAYDPPMNTDDLLAIEQIKQLKARYFRFVDTKQWDALADLFTLEGEVRFGESEADRWIVGRHRIVRILQRTIGDGVTVHQGFMPEIEITGPATAVGTWAMHDLVDKPSGDRPIQLRGYGHYYESYAKEPDGVWRIARLQLTRVRVDPL